VSEQLFLSHGFDRSTHLRDDETRLNRALAGEARLVTLWRKRNLLSVGDAPAALFPNAAAHERPRFDRARSRTAPRLIATWLRDEHHGVRC